ncbi:unnamed protein product [Clavelina lepadiformis]|uniref:ADP-ribosylglycohydrolase n=1 Tax=Clavelina lepadiformis TaxID=159417 RepID=A0ABP0H3V6_CLALP
MTKTSAAVLKTAVTQAYQGLFIGDAVAMPVHWYYNVPAIKDDYNGWISKYEKPKDDHPTSILRHSNTGGSGRSHGSQSDPVIGKVILHDKLDAWSGRSNASHYHQGMEAGDNTLNCHCAFRLMQTLHDCPKNMTDEAVLKQAFVDYVTFMTTPGSHNDTYAESYHRKFFADWVKAGGPIDPEDLFKFTTDRSKRMLIDTQLDVIGAFVVPTAIILHNIHRPIEEVTRVTQELYSRTHPVDGIIEPMNAYIRILHAVVRGGSLKDEAEKALKEHLGPAGGAMIRTFDQTVISSKTKLAAFQRIGEKLGLACYVNGAFAVMLYLARHFYDDFEGGILTNVNIGGENCHRGAALGALLGASSGALKKTIPAKWVQGLRFGPKIDQVLNSEV